VTALLALLWAGGAWAASAGGYRVGHGLPADLLATREVLVVAPGGPWVFQAMLEGRVTFGKASLDLEVPALYTWTASGWRDAGLGRVRAGAWLHVGGGPTLDAVGLEASASVFPQGTRVDAWGSIARETVTGADVLFAWEHTWTPDSPLTTRLAFGFASTPYRDGQTAWPAVEVALVKVWAISPAFALVTEGEVLVDRVPATLRVLGRWDPSARWSADLGIQAPAQLGSGAFEHRTVQVVGQVRTFF
jgi:hypothetical protein